MFRYLKKLASVVKTKICRRSNEVSRLTWNIVRTHRTDIKRIMVFGDSNSFRPEQSKTSWPKLFENKDPRHFKVFNDSHDGRTTSYDFGELNGLSVINKKLTAYKPLDFVFVMLGTNDVKSKYGPPSPAEIADGMRQIMEIINNHEGCGKCILLTPPPLGNVVSGDLSGAQMRIPPVATEYRLLAMNSNIQIVDIYSIIDTNTDLDSDMIHINAIGRQKVVNAVWNDFR
jgi:lysophospholipase L1-like esterase